MLVQLQCVQLITDKTNAVDLSSGVGLFTVFTAQCTLVHLRGLGIACRPSVRLSVRPSVTLVIYDHIVRNLEK